MSRLRGYRLTEMAMPAVVWAAHFVAVYAMAGLACEQAWQRERIAGIESVTWLIAVGTLLAWVALGLIARNGWRGRSTQPRAPEGGAQRVDPMQPRKRFLSTVTLAMAAIAAVAVLFTVIPVFLLPTCAG